MNRKPSYEELEKRVKKLEDESIELKQSREQLIPLEELRVSKERYRALFDNSPIATITVDHQARITRYNLAKKKEDSNLPKIGDVMYKDYAVRHSIDMHKELMECIRLGLHKQFPGQKYNEKYLDIKMAPFPGGAIITSIDTTSRKLVEEKLRVNEEKYRFIAENATDVLWSADLQGNILFVSPNCVSMIGYTHEECIGMNIFELLVPDSASKCLKLLAQRLESDIERRQDNYSPLLLEHEYKNKDGSTHSGEVSVKFTRDKDNNPIGLIGTTRDITEKIKLQIRLVQAQKMEAISNLAGGIAHQFNNALAVITASLDLVDIENPENEKISKFTNQMKVSAQRMADLTSQLLAYARGGKYREKTVSLSSLIKDIIPLVEHTLTSSIHFETDIPDTIPAIKADLTQMQMVMSAILSNCSEAIEGQGHIKIKCRTRQISKRDIEDFQGIEPGSYVCLSIEDDGSGMDEQSRAKIFEPFYTTRFQGRGLGMAAAYGIIKNHDGGIYVESEPGKGTRINIYLPTVAPPLEEHVFQKHPNESGTILLVEDEEMVMDVSKELLANLGYKVLEASTGQEAVNIAKTYEDKIDVALLDIILPDMPGKEVYSLLSKTIPDLKIIVCSGYSIEGPAGEIMDAGAEGFLQKPFTIEGLSEKIYDVLSAN